MPSSPSDFPLYSPAEQAADRAVHVVGLTAATAAIPWLLLRLGPESTGLQVVSIAIYSFGLAGMLAASALYNLAPAGRVKAVLRRVDHAMIFVMIAGSYTPFALTALRPGVGVPLCAAVWTLAVVGIALKVAFLPRYERLSLILYLGMGWLVVAVFPSLRAAVPGAVVVLLVAGGVIYSLGSFIHARARLPFHNAVWHAMVVVAAGLHLAAVAQLLPG